MDEQIWAGPRDASCVDRPNTSDPKKVHVAVVTGEVSATWWSPSELVADAACDPMRMPLDMTLGRKAGEVPEARRCRRRGCASRWPAYQGAGTTGSKPSDGAV